ncbi:HtaA domain-containing protein [Streptomyces durmitorensis]|uniref:HtaA domain-containing protein n=1 Tax=Streptomyces durmitorensis TaxID=319947 RepID=A0ABY4PZK6_9ACTN|nr:HtaA domain-containing protein [Streptomyces durmitorensis]UQT58880.1 HtaA domain-containing protein [Streptomyces durmitorensis]
MAANRRPITLAAAVATAVTLGATALTLPALAADSGNAAAPQVELKDGTLDWGFKESFRKYVTGMAAGKIEATDGAKQAADNGVFTFTDGKGTYDTGTHATDVAFKGSVRFSSTAHGFDIKVADVKVRTKGTSGAIQADVSLNGTAQNDIDVAKLDLTGITPGTGEGGAMTYKDIPATLTADGAKAFNGMYKEGDKLDPATLSVKQGGAPTEKPTETPKPTDKPTETPKPTAKPTETPKPTAKPTATATPKPTSGTEQPAGEVHDGSLAWGVKESFRRYIESGGGATLSGGAEKNDNGYDFPYAKGDVDSDAKKLDASFGGAVRFQYKAHGIDMKFSDIKVAASGTKGTLTVDVTTPKGTNNDVKFATLDLSKASYTAKDDVVVLDKVPAAFTAAGAKQFESEDAPSGYKEGDAIDPVTVALAVADGAQLPGGSGGTGDTAGTGGSGSTGGGSSDLGGSVGGGTGGSMASTGASVPTGALLGTAGVIVAAGAGAVFVARRRTS